MLSFRLFWFLVGFLCVCEVGLFFFSFFFSDLTKFLVLLVKYLLSRGEEWKGTLPRCRLQPKAIFLKWYEGHFHKEFGFCGIFFVCFGRVFLFGFGIFLLLHVFCCRKITSSCQAKLMMLLLLVLVWKVQHLRRCVIPFQCACLWEIVTSLSPAGCFVHGCLCIPKRLVPYTWELEFPLISLVGGNEINYKQILFLTTIPGNSMLLWACLFSTFLSCCDHLSVLRNGADSLFKNLL